MPTADDPYPDFNFDFDARPKRKVEKPPLIRDGEALSTKELDPAWELPRALGFGEAMRMQRTMRGLSLQQVADVVGCGRSYLSQIETGINIGTPAAALVAGIERVLGMREGDLAERSAWRSAPEPIKQHIARVAQRDRAAQQLARFVRERGIDELYRSGELGALVDQIAPPPPPSVDASVSSAASLASGLGKKQSAAASSGKVAVNAGSQRAQQELDSAPIEMPLEVPLINSVTAGYPRAFTDLGYPARVADQYVRSPDVRDPDAFACRVVGDSMTPDYREGDVVIFSPAKTVKDGGDCFVRFERDAETTFKRVFFERAVVSDEKSPVVRLRLQPLNEKYPSRVVEREDIAGLYAAVSVMRAIG